MSRIAMMGSGAWGTALAISLARRGGHEIALWSYAKDVAATMREQRENTAFLPGFQIPESVAIFEDAAEALDRRRDCRQRNAVAVCPFVRMKDLHHICAPGQLLVSATKGIEDETYLRMTRSDWRSAGGARAWNCPAAC